MCSPPPPEFSLTLLSLDPHDWMSVLVAALIGVAGVCIILCRFKPGVPQRIALISFTCAGLLFPTGVFISTVAQGGFQGAYNGWLLAAMNPSNQICSTNGFDLAISSHDAISAQLDSFSSNLYIAAVAIVVLCGVFLSPVLEKHARRRANAAPLR
jgi:bacteriorhodopsin